MFIGGTPYIPMKVDQCSDKHARLCIRACPTPTEPVYSMHTVKASAEPADFLSWMCVRGNRIEDSNVDTEAEQVEEKGLD